MPYLGSTVLVCVCVAVCLLSLCGSWLLVRSLAPAFHDRAARACTEHLGLTTLLGLVATSAIVLFAAVLAAAGPGFAKAIVVLLASVAGAASIAGSAGLATRVGAGLASRDDDRHPWHATARGAIVLCASFLTPLLGWLVLVPLALVAGLGAALTSAASGLAARVSRPSRRHIGVAGLRSVVPRADAS